VGDETPDERRRLVNAFIERVVADADTLAPLITQEQGKPLAKARSEINSASSSRAATQPSTWRQRSCATPAATRRTAPPPLAWLARSRPGTIPCCWRCGRSCPQCSPATRRAQAFTVHTGGDVALGGAGPGHLPARSRQRRLGWHDLGAWMTEHPGIRKIAFTGSGPTGKRIMASAAGNLKRLTLELGGNDAGIVLDDVDPRRSLPTCSGPSSPTAGRSARRSSACTCTAASTARSATSSRVRRYREDRRAWKKESTSVRSRTARSTTWFARWSTKRSQRRHGSVQEPCAHWPRSLSADHDPHRRHACDAVVKEEVFGPCSRSRRTTTRTTRCVLQRQRVRPRRLRLGQQSRARREDRGAPRLGWCLVTSTPRWVRTSVRWCQRLRHRCRTRSPRTGGIHLDPGAQREALLIPERQMKRTTTQGDMMSALSRDDGTTLAEMSTGACRTSMRRKRFRRRGPASARCERGLGRLG